MSDTIVIPLFRDGAVSPENAIIDRADWALIAGHRWRATRGRSNQTYYAVYRVGEVSVFMHRLILNPGPDKVVDHINGNGLDNRRSNLRACTEHENRMHTTRLQERNRHGYLGIGSYTVRGGRRRWTAEIRMNRKKIYLGAFDTMEQAIEARVAAEKRLFGDFAPTVEHSVVQAALPGLFLLVAVLGLLAGFTANGIGAEPTLAGYHHQAAESIPGRWMTVKASAYCPCSICCGERAAGLTADGTSVLESPYGVAAHPRYLPYGSLVIIPIGQGYLDRTRTDRLFRVDDTGGVVRRRTVETDDLWIDLRFRSHATAKAWGVRTIAIFVVDPTN